MRATLAGSAFPRRAVAALARRAALALASALLAACTDHVVMHCTADVICGNEIDHGSCLPSPRSLLRFCAYPDKGCPSGLRWDSFAGDGLAGLCYAPTDAGPPPSDAAPDAK